MPVDNFKAKCESQVFRIDNRLEPYELLGIMFYPQRNREGKYLYHFATLQGNLLAKIDICGVLSIENSLNKFLHGNNFTDFTLSEIQSSIEKVENILKIPSNEFRLIRIELGLNVLSVKQLYEYFSLYRSNSYENMRSGKTIYGRKFYLTDFNVKAYNKLVEMQLNPNSFSINDRDYSNDKKLNRFEIEYKRMRELKACGLIMLSDLMNKDVMEKVMHRAMEKFKVIEMSKKYDYSLLTSRERELLFAGKNPDFWKTEKSKNYNTYKEKKAKYRSCIKKLDNNLLKQIDPKMLIMKVISDKVNYLLSH